MIWEIIFMMLFAIFATAGIAGADYLLVDQSHMANVNSWHNLSYYKFDQEFQPSFSSMDEVEVAIHTNEGAILQVSILKGSVGGPLIGMSEDLYLPPGFSGMARVIFQSPLSLASGESYIIDLRLIDGSAFIGSSFEGGGYADGRMFINEINTPTDNSDIIFRTGLVQSDLIDIIRGSDMLCRNVKPTDKLLIEILSSDLFDATTVNPVTVNFAEAGVKKVGKNGQYHCHEEDTNNDGLIDLVCQIDSTQLVIEEGSLSIVVKAETFDGMTIIGEEPIYTAQP